MKFDLKQLSLSLGWFSALMFILWWAMAQYVPSAELHRQLLMEALPWMDWPLGLGEWIVGLIVGFIWGAVIGWIFGMIFNYFSSKK